MKAFVLGVITGAILCFALIRISETKEAVSPEASSADANLAVDIPLQPASCSESSGQSQAEARSSNIAVEQIASVAGKEGEVLPANAPHIASDMAKFIEQLSEKDVAEICSRAAALQQKKEREKKDAEPKDASWAYSMEMLIRQHVESRISNDQYTKLQIQCRTTFCELTMEGREQEVRERVSRVLQEIERQTWSDIVQWGQGGGSDGNRWHLNYEWYRPRAEERAFLFRLRDERAASAPK